MKKLFVLFLLVALVPFTVGCGLFGDNDDTTPINVAKLKASVTMPVSLAGKSLRAVKVPASKFSGFKVLIGNFTLVAVAEEEISSGNWLVDFETIESFNADQLAAIKNGNVNVTVLNGADEPVGIATADFSAGVPTSIPVVVNSNKTITSVNNTSVTPIVVGTIAQIVSVTNANKAVNASTDIAKNTTSGLYEFVVTTDVELPQMVLHDADYSVLVGDTSVEARHFTASVTGKTVTLSLSPDVKLAANKVYTVKVNYINVKVNDINAGVYTVANKSFSFKTPATL